MYLRVKWSGPREMWRNSVRFWAGWCGILSTSPTKLRIFVFNSWQRWDWPNVWCLKGHKRYEFDVEVDVAVTNWSNFASGGLTFSSNPYDGHAVGNSAQSSWANHQKEAKKMFVDRGCHGHGVSGLQVFISRLKCGVNARQKRLLKRSKTIEPVGRAYEKWWELYRIVTNSSWQLPGSTWK